VLDGDTSRLKPAQPAVDFRHLHRKTMPTPLDLLRDPFAWTVFAAFFVLAVLEWRRPARAWPRVPWWPLKGTAAFALYFLLSSYLPLWWGETLVAWRLVDLTGLGVAEGTLVGLLVYELGVWAWHRAMHRWRPLWLAFHQMHHSAERLDVWGAFWFSPLDMFGWTLLGSLALTVVVGLAPQAVTAVLLIATLLAMVQHANLRTPRWLGWLVQRPESHSLHHARGVHAYNYADLPLIDMLFGTFRNPTHYVTSVGFHDGASGRLWPMLTFADVSEPAPARRDGRAAPNTPEVMP
jgi:sterol desaturase/sphingolipid hydroxylase (fatty acid hydroxylase superfamily)